MKVKIAYQLSDQYMKKMYIDPTHTYYIYLPTGSVLPFHFINWHYLQCIDAMMLALYS